MSLAWKHARKIVVLVIGASILLFGVALLVLPGPGTVVIAAGLGVLATEFIWARRWLRRFKETGVELGRSVMNSINKNNHSQDQDHS